MDRGLITPTMMVRLALVALDKAPRNDDLTGTVRVPPIKTVTFPRGDMALVIGDWSDQYGTHRGFNNKWIVPAMEEWSLTMPHGAKFDVGHRESHEAYEVFNGIGMCGHLQFKSDGDAHLTLKIFPR